MPPLREEMLESEAFTEKLRLAEEKEAHRQNRHNRQTLPVHMWRIVPVS